MVSDCLDTAAGALALPKATASGLTPIEALSAEADALSGFIMATIQGMSTLARDGASRDKLLAVAACAMRAWPTIEAMEKP